MLSLPVAFLGLPAGTEASGLLPLEPGHHHHSHHHGGNKGAPKTASFDDERPPATGSPPIPGNETTSSTWTCGENGCWPLFYVIGVQKGATTSLFKALQRADIVCGATWFPLHNDFYKEAHYFDRDSNFNGDTAIAPVTYTKLYKTDDKCLGNTFMDATPNYGFMLGVADRIGATLPPSVKSQAKLIYILREPIARDISLYNMLRGSWSTLEVKTNNLNGGNVQKLFCKDATKSFPSYSEGASCMVEMYHSKCEVGEAGSGTAYDRCGGSSEHGQSGMHNRLVDAFYAPQLTKYSSVFDRKQIMVIQFDVLLSSNQPEILKSLASWMGAASTRRLHKMPDDNNAGSFGGKVTQIDCGTKASMMRIFAPWNEKLNALMTAAQADGSAPAEEPKWVPFSEVSCSQTGEVTGN